MTGKVAYWIAHVTITDVARYEKYRRMAFSAVTSHGGEFVARGGRFMQMEGPERTWNTVAVFPSFQAALDCYKSDAYQEALTISKTSSIRELVIVEGI